jgi:hypothetical protein
MLVGFRNALEHDACAGHGVSLHPETCGKPFRRNAERHP